MYIPVTRQTPFMHQPTTQPAPAQNRGYACVCVCVCVCPCSSLGFAGTILVRNNEGAQYVRDQGPSAILQAVGHAWDS